MKVEELMDGVIEVQRRLSAEFETTDNQLNDGPGGQEVPHVHFHNSRVPEGPIAQCGHKRGLFRA